MIKRIFDIVTSVVVLLLLSPVIFVVCFKIMINLGWPIFFKQLRPGKDGRPFYIVKLRTMREATDSKGNQLPDSERLTPFTTWLRSTSLDEIPELWNVLKGEMSLVGPRPLLMEYQPLYNEFQKKRQNVKPGITGWAQINGRNQLSWDEKFCLDVWYVQNRSFWLDLKILLVTIKKVIIREGISAEGEATMPVFKGNDS